MNNIVNFISEKLKLDKNIRDQYNYHPKDKKELKDIIKKLLKERGNEADLNDIDTSEITDMSELFDLKPKFNGNISEWDTSNVKNMRFMFCDTDFAGDISNWDVSNVEDMYNMFYACNYFNCNLNKWDVKNVKDMEEMFKYSPLEKNPPKWYHE